MNINTNPVRDYRSVENGCHSNPVRDYRTVASRYRNPIRDYRSVASRYRINPVRDYRSVENGCHKTSHAVRYATRMLQYGCIPYGMQGTYDIQFSTERYIPTECSTKHNFLPDDTFLRNEYNFLPVDTFLRNVQRNTIFYRAIHSYGMFNETQFFYWAKHSYGMFNKIQHYF